MPLPPSEACAASLTHSSLSSCRQLRVGGVAVSTAVLVVSLAPLSPAVVAMIAIPSTRTATSRGRHPVQLPRVLDYLVTQLAHGCAHSAPAEQSCSDLPVVVTVA